MEMPRKPSNPWSTTLIIVYINVALYATCFQMQRPLEPFLVEKLNVSGDSADQYAQLQSFFSIVQTVGSFFSGRCLDYFGAKGGFIVCFVASAMSYALLSQATTIEMLYISKVPTILQAGFLCAQVAASQATSDGAERVQALGRLTMSYTVGSVLGPTIGGLLGASGDYYLGAKLAVAGSLLSVILSCFMPNEKQSEGQDAIDEDIKVAGDNTGNETTGDSTKVSQKNQIPSTYAVVSVVWLFLATKVITSVANAMAAAAMPLILKNTYGMGEKELGFSMSIMSACNAVVNGLFLGPIVGLAGGDLKIVIGVCVASMCAVSAMQSCAALPAAVAFSPAGSGGMYEYLGLSFVLSMFQYVLSTTITGESTARVGPAAKGTLLGIEHALFALARVGAPQVGVSLLKSGGVSSVCAACSGIFAGVFGLWQCFKDHKTMSIKSSEEEERKGK
mmetsp:Transcript_6468/g.10886  ORF Transcript_6468/g.10886 Transcript_6468/m.10886 type:complete len:448 (+) Transcript_6468:95-1438(+)|eukprot:CAMPEP_0175019334 /NCGR_PEP_ID=MMETSP0005-20121125/13499_1 /TAXON_ID=420556 /ORGANISM="Ochromonas sp., Strain CCMP1393" /LENGTH=447 /DNA_ID=CAMNT_0016277055 /DNA_START=65 /DNA_END=1408 /DNA_ORIENTATION=-